jgi:glucose-6-phosphate-specific signal transduction histidine kinase
VYVAVEARDGVLGLSIRDDGCGGADPTRGSGLIGLTDRVDALAGTIHVASPIGAGTTLLITLPLDEGYLPASTVWRLAAVPDFLLVTSRFGGLP